MPKFTPEEIEKHALKGFHLGLSVKRIAEDLGTTEAHVREIGQRAGLIEKTWQDRAVEMYVAGKHTSEIAETLRVPMGLVTSAVKRSGVRLRPPHNRISRIGDEMRRRFLAGERICEIARAMGRRPQNVQHAVRRLRVN